ncbi:hypothetical protein EDB85DRAFT_244773 [Lactarius pseudohatsudake]|nr:hypothetical protein EDB85DRAFT_244773 [Lactarius pseudohatsudake]
MNEPELEDAQLAHEQAEDRAAQLKPEYSPVRMQLDDKDAEERLAEDPENKLRDQVAALEARCAAARPKKTAMATASVSPPPRPDSRTSTVYALPHRWPLPA